MMECFFGNILADVLLLLLFALSEWIGHNKNIKENSIYDWIHNKLKKIVRGE
jgi:hypothetical protein